MTTAEKRNLLSFTKEIRTAIADYIGSEGCSCCRGASHGEHKEKIAKMLRIPKYKDGSGYDFGKYRTKKLIVKKRK